jgi:hypothetical protein
MNGYGTSSTATSGSRATGAVRRDPGAVAALFWVRGTGADVPGALARAGRRLRGGAGLVLASLFVLFAATGAWIFHNTNVLNRYVASDTVLDRQARYEQEYRKYKDAPSRASPRSRPRSTYSRRSGAWPRPGATTW